LKYNTLRVFLLQGFPSLEGTLRHGEIQYGFVDYYILYNWHLVTAFLVIVKQVQTAVVFLKFKDKTTYGIDIVQVTKFIEAVLFFFFPIFCLFFSLERYEWIPGS